MLSLHKRKRMVLPAVMMAMIMIPAVVLAIGKVIEAQNTSAITYPIPSGYTTITDANFYDCVATEFVKEYPGEEIPSTGLTDEQLGKIQILYCNGRGKADGEKIANTNGLEKMTALTELELHINLITSIDVSKNTALTRLVIFQNQLSSLDVSKNVALTTLYISDNHLTSLDISKNLALEKLYVSGNQLTSLNVSRNTALTYLEADSNSLTSIDVSNNTLLNDLRISNNQLTSLNTANNLELGSLSATSNQLSSIDVSNNVALTNLRVSNNQLTSLNVSNNRELTNLDVRNNQLTSLDVSNATRLKSLNASNNKLTFLGVSNNAVLETLDASSNRLSSLNLSSGVGLKKVNVGTNQLSSIILPDTNVLEELSVSSNQLTSLDLSKCYVLKNLSIGTNQLVSLDVSNNEALEKLYAGNNQLTSLNVSNNAALEELVVNQNQLTSVDLSGLTALKQLDVSRNNLSSLNISNNTALTHLLIYNNRLSIVDVSNSVALAVLDADDILVRTNVAPLALTSNITYDFSGLGFIKDDQTINNTDQYSYNSNSKILTVNNYSGTNGYAQLSSYFMNRTFKIQLPIFATLNANGGTGGDEMQSCYPNYGESTCTITPTAPTRDNYYFLGWADSASATSATYAVGSSITLSEPKALYAIWAPIYRLSFNVNSGSGSVTAKTCHPTTTNGTCKITIPEAELSRDNYYYLGWADSGTATSAVYQSGEKVTMSGNKTIYAIWAPIYALSFDANGGSGAPAKQTCHPSTTNGSCTVMVPNTAPTLDRHTFLGYADTSDAETASSNYEASKTVTLSANKTIFAVWQRNPIEPVDPEISFANSTVNKTYGDGNFANAAITNSDGVVTYSSNNTAVATVNATTGVLTIKGAGSATITANVAATDEYNAGSASYALTVAKATPTISFTNNEVNKVYGDANFTNTATTSGNGAITYSSNNTAVATVNSASGEVTIRGAGRATITANVASTSNYNAVSGTYVLIVSTSTPEISFANSTMTKTYGDEGFTNTATTNSDGAVTYSSNNTTVATVNATTGAVTIRGAGNATITANVAATSSYAGATARYTLVVNKKASVAPSEVEEVKTGYTDDSLSTIPLTTEGLSWEDENTRIREGHNSYRVNYTENNDTANYTTEQFEIVVNGKQKSSGGGSEDEGSNQDGSKDEGKNGIIAVPNTGETTANFDNINVVYCILFAVLMVGLGAGFYVYRNKKAHRKFEW